MRKITIFKIMAEIDKDTFCKTCEKYGFFRQDLGEDIYYTLKRDAKHYICKRRSTGTICITLGTQVTDDGEFTTDDGCYIITDVRNIEDMEDFIELALKRYKRMLSEYRANQIKQDFIE